MRHRERVFLAILTLITAYFLIWPLWRTFFPMEITPAEGWNAYHQDAAVRGPLYPPGDSLIVNNYPPLSFYTVGWLSLLFGDALYVGRVFTIAATFGLGIVIAIAIRQLGGGKVASGIGGIWFVAVMASAFNRFIGMDDPRLFAQLLMGIALIWFLARDARGQSAEPPILLMVVAGFWKHNAFVIPVLVLLWLLLRDGRRAWRPIVVGAAASAAGLLACILIFGDVFLANLLTPRGYNLTRVFLSLGRLQWVAPALVIWAVWAWHERQTTVARFTALFVALGLISYLVQWAGEAVLDNAQFDLLMAVAIGLGIAYERANALVATTGWSVARLRGTVVLILAVRLLATTRYEPMLILFDPGYRAEFSAHAEIVKREAARVAAIKGEVGCSNKLVCRFAGKPFAVDDFRAEQLVNTGIVTEAGLQALMKQRGITMVEIDPRANIEPLHRDFVRELTAWYRARKS